MHQAGVATVRIGGRRHRRIARTWALLLAALIALSTLALEPGPAHAADEPDLRIELTDLSPAVVRTNDVLTITGTLINHTDSELAAPDVRLMMQRHVPVGRAALTSWNDGTTNNNVLALTGWNQVGGPIPAGGSITFIIELPTAGTFEEQSAWGPRGIEIQARSGQTHAQLRTSLLWYPTQEPLDAPAEISLLVPLTPTATEWQQAIDSGSPVGVVAAPRLLELLAAVGPQASLALDPILLDTAVPGETTNDVVSPRMDSVQRSLIEQLADAGSHQDLIALGYGDIDLASLAAHQADGFWADAQQRGAMLLEQAGLSVEDVAWPAGRVSAGALAVLARGSTDAVILDAYDRVTVSATEPRATATAGSISVDALVADTGLSESLLSTSMQPVQARQAMLALSAVATRGLASQPGGLLLTLPRDVDTDLFEELTTRLDALRAAPWAEAASLRALLGRSASDLSIPLPSLAPAQSGISGTDLRALLGHRELIGSYAQAAGPALTDRYQPSLLMPLSATLTQAPQLRTQLLDEAARAAGELQSSISIEDGSSVLLISGTGAMPVTITNTLATPASVYVQLVPTGPQLQVEQVPRVDLPASGSTTIRIPINAVANGNVIVGVHLMSSVNGEDLAPPASFAVRVRADWENIGTAAVAVVLAVAFIVGLVRTIRRGRRGDGSSAASSKGGS